jgi:hypothetical protein
MPDLVFTLPEEVVRDAREAGLLTSTVIADLLKGEVERRRRIDTLFAAMDRAADSGHPEMTLEEIQREVDAVRDLRRGAGASRAADRR